MAIGTVALDILVLLGVGLPAWSGHLGFIISKIGIEVIVTLVIGTVGYLIAAALTQRLPASRPRSAV
jgi:uncharacterized protein involved in cysteine biosynthesis